MMDPKNKQAIIDVDAVVVPVQESVVIPPSLEGLKSEIKRLRQENESYNEVVFQLSAAQDQMRDSQDQLRDALALVKKLKTKIDTQDKKIARLERRVGARVYPLGHDTSASSENDEDGVDSSSATSSGSSDPEGQVGNSFDDVHNVHNNRGYRATRGHTARFSRPRGGRHSNKRTRAQISRERQGGESASDEADTSRTERRQRRTRAKVSGGSNTWNDSVDVDRDVEVETVDVSTTSVNRRSEGRKLRGRSVGLRSNVENEAEGDTHTGRSSRRREVPKSLPNTQTQTQTQIRKSTRTRTRPQRSGVVSHTNTDDEHEYRHTDDSTASGTGSEDKQDEDDAEKERQKLERIERERQEFEKWDTEWNPLFRSANVPVDPAMVPTVEAAEKTAQKEAIQVPGWRVVVEQTDLTDDHPGHFEDTSDAAYEKRHRKYEALEKRRKRTDHERLLIDQQLATAQAGVKEADHARGNTAEHKALVGARSLFPNPYTNLKAIEVTMNLPYVAWGASVPKELCYRLQESRHESARERAKRCQPFALPVSGPWSFQTEMMTRKAQPAHKRSRTPLPAPVQATSGRMRTRVNSTTSVASTQSNGRTLSTAGSGSKRIKRDLSDTKRRTSSRLHATPSTQSKGPPESITRSKATASSHDSKQDKTLQKTASRAERDRPVGRAGSRSSMRTRNSSVPMGDGETDRPRNTHSNPMSGGMGTRRTRTTAASTQMNTRTRSQTPTHTLKSLDTPGTTAPNSASQVKHAPDSGEHTSQPTTTDNTATAQELASPSALPPNGVWRARSLDSGARKSLLAGSSTTQEVPGDSDNKNETRPNEAGSEFDTARTGAESVDTDSDEDLPQPVSINDIATGSLADSKKAAGQAPLLLRFKRVTPSDSIE